MNNATVSATLIQGLLNYISEFGLELNDVPISPSLQLTSLDYSEKRLPAKEFIAIWLAIEDKVEDPDFGLHLCEQSRKLPSGDILTAVMLNCPTVGVAMEKLSHYHALATDLVQVLIWEQEDLNYYGWEPGSTTFKQERQISEAVICQIMSTLLGLTNGKIRLREVHFQHPKPNQIAEHRRIFPCPVFFNQPRDAVLTLRKSLDLPIPLASPNLLQRFELIATDMLADLYSPDTWSVQVSQQISNSLLLGKKPNISMIAASLNISTRHLQNKLKEEDVTYQILLDQIRQELAQRYLQSLDINLYDVAFLLGYADQSAFIHAFKRWTGRTPSEYRRGIERPAFT
jgi:AraC-like DNA-binding protein